VYVTDTKQYISYAHGMI